MRESYKSIFGRSCYVKYQTNNRWSGWQGYTDNYIHVFAAGDALANRITPARLCGAFEDGLEALVVGGDS